MRTLLLNPSCKTTLNAWLERYYIRSGSRWPHSGVKLKNSRPHYLPFPFSLAYGAAVLKQDGFDVQVIDAVALDMGEAALLDEIVRLKPRLVFYECSTPTFARDMQLAGRIKHLTNAKVAIAGMHADAFCMEILAGQRSVDFVLHGEYEWPLLGLARALRDGRDDFPPGMAYRRQSLVVETGSLRSPVPLDDLPFPLREYFPCLSRPQPQVYWDGFCQFRPALQMQTSRGCRWQCYFCLPAHNSRQSGGFRVFSAGRVIAEMRELINRYGAREIYFDDDNFTADKGHVFDVCQEMLKSGVRVPWSCTGDIIGLDKNTLQLMSRSGCVGIKFGIESGSPRIMQSVGKPVDLKKAAEVIGECRKLAIKTQAAFTIGLLGETAEDLQKTFYCARSLKADALQVSIATPFPGTEFYRLAKNSGVLRDAGWEAYDGKTSALIRSGGTENLAKTKRRFLLRWFFGRMVSFPWAFRHGAVLVRTVRGVGVTFFLRQVFAVIIDEWKNR